jgi:hypothetical protein
MATLVVAMPITFAKSDVALCLWLPIFSGLRSYESLTLI